MSEESPPLGKLLEQVQRIQADVQEAAERAASMVAEGSAGAGLVTASANGKGQLLKLQVDASLMEKGDVDLLTDLICGAVNQALDRAREETAEALRKASGGLPLPEGFPFGGN